MSSTGWYNAEHLPGLFAVSGILSAARCKTVKGGPNKSGVQ
jgi:hypothetical protein